MGFIKNKASHKADKKRSTSLESELEIAKMQRTFQALIQESNDIFEIIDRNGLIKYISPASEKITGLKPQERVGKNVLDFYVGKELEELEKMLGEVAEESNKRIQGELIYRTKDGRTLPLEVSMHNLLHDPDISGIVINFRDISRRVEMQKRISHILTHDKVTGLPNIFSCSRQLRRHCKETRENGGSFALIMLDIDRFKDIKYALGYEIIDKLAIKIVDRIKSYLLERAFVSRYSEDHFTIITRDLGQAEAYEKMAQEIIDLFSKPFKIESYELDIDVNIGSCIFPDDAKDAESLRKHTKNVLLRAKREGANSYKFYSSGMDIVSYREFVLKSDLHNAIKREQLKIYYQPIVNMMTSKIIGAESLIRWEHPDWGLVPPDEFIYLAEETGLINDIGKWVLQETCKSYRKWKKARIANIKLSINISPIQTLEKNWARRIVDIIHKNKLDPNFLIMELTEGILLRDFDKISLDIKELQSHGIEIALDDFGTGFSSLAYLNSFNIDILKIDRSFIKGIPSNKTCSIITRSIVELAKELKIKLVAEGIEDWDQLSYLKALNCYGGQGFLYNEPMPLEEFEVLLKNGYCTPMLESGRLAMAGEERRKFFRIDFFQLLETSLTIISFKGEKINVGNTGALIKNIGPGGLCFISNIRFPVERDVILQFTTNLIGEEIKVYGHPVWTKGLDDDLYKYGVKFTIDENERTNLIRILNRIQIKMRKNILFAEGSFISGSCTSYFKSS